MLQYEKIDVSEGIETNKTSASKKYMLFQYCYFKDVGFKFEPPSQVVLEDKGIL